MCKQRVIFFVAAALVVIPVLDAQLIHDPNDALYKDVDRWAVQGYITETLPMIRPYPLQLIDELLADVVDNGDDEAVEKALRYRDALLIGEGARNSGTAVYAPDSGLGALHVGVTGSFEGIDDDASILGAPFVDGTLRLKDWITGSFSMFVYGSNRAPAEGYNVPGTYTPYPDMISDTSDVGSLQILQDWTSALAIGTSELYFQSGLIRSSVGPLYDNGIVVGPQAPRAGHFNLTYRRPLWSFEMLWLELVASDTTGGGRYAGKHLVSHIYNFRPVPSFEVAFFETIVWGDRLEPLYLLPFSMLFASQSMADFGDNAFMGLLVRWRFAPNLQLQSQIFVDDFHFNDMVRFKFNTKYKLAGELGIVWAPKEGPLRSLSADYTAVLPYMYTHMYSLDEDTYDDRYPPQVHDPINPYFKPPANYMDYSHIGVNLGPNLEPNSDRISVRSSWKTLPNLDLGVSAYFTRHGNASENRIDEDLMDEEFHDGSIFDDGSNDGEFAGKGEAGNYDNNYRRVRFLTQSVLETKLAGGVTLKWSLPTRLGELSLNAEYVAEYGWNRGLKSGEDGFVHYWALGGSYRF